MRVRGYDVNRQPIWLDLGPGDASMTRRISGSLVVGDTGAGGRVHSKKEVVPDYQARAAKGWQTRRQS